MLCYAGYQSLNEYIGDKNMNNEKEEEKNFYLFFPFPAPSLFVPISEALAPRV